MIACLAYNCNKSLNLTDDEVNDVKQGIDPTVSRPRTDQEFWTPNSPTKQQSNEEAATVNENDIDLEIQHNDMQYYVQFKDVQ
jgi:hypothetical protein